MKILFVHNSFGAWAGAEANILATARELRLRGHSLGLLHGDGTGKEESDWMETFSARFPLSEENSFSIVKTALADFQPDLIYVHKMADLKILENLVSSGVPLARMVHDHDLYCMRGYKYNVFTRQICTRKASPFCVFPCGASFARNTRSGFPVKWVSYAKKRRELHFNRQFNRLIVNSNYLRTELMQNGFDADKIELHVPVPPAVRQEPVHSFSDRNLIVYAGQIIRGKGVDVLLDALGLVQSPFECMILGEGSHRAYCEEKSRKLGLADRVHFKGHVSSEKMSRFYRQCSVVVMSSLWPEPLGMVGIEAMRHGLPVVAFDAGGIKEWLIDSYNGYLVRWMDCEAYAARVDELLSNKALARLMGRRGLQQASRQYDFSNYIAGLENMFARVVSEARCAMPA